jgi:hypothetical protein
MYENILDAVKNRLKMQVTTAFDQKFKPLCYYQRRDKKKGYIKYYCMIDDKILDDVLETNLSINMCCFKTNGIKTYVEFYRDVKTKHTTIRQRIGSIPNRDVMNIPELMIKLI